MGDLQLFIPEAAVLVTAMIAFTLTAFDVNHKVSWTSGVLCALAALVITACHLSAHGEPFFPGIYRVDAFSQLLKLGIVAGLFLTLLVSADQGSARPSARVDMPFFFALSALGMMMLVSATELLTLYVALELSAYGLYIAAALHRAQREGSEAAVKYILFGAAASAVSLYGLSLIYGVTQTTYLSDIAAATPSPLLLVGVLLALSGVMFKLALFPFHAWAPDTYQASPHHVATFIGTVSKVAAVGVLVRLVSLTVSSSDQLVNMLLALCVASMTFGNLAALVQNDLKRLLAYSTIAHAGYILIGIASFSNLGTAAAIFYVLLYVPIAYCAFVVVCAVGADGTNPSKKSIAGLHKRSPLLAAALLVGMFGLAGIPPTAGFIGKWFLFTSALEADLFWLVLVAAINATVSLYYYLIIIKEAYLCPPENDTPLVVSSPYRIAAWLGIGLVIVAGFWPSALWTLASQAASASLPVW